MPVVPELRSPALAKAILLRRSTVADVIGNAPPYLRSQTFPYWPELHAFKGDFLHIVSRANNINTIIKFN